MRLRNIPDANVRIAKNDCFVEDPVVYIGKWRERFPHAKELHVEIGSGKGRFITTLAAQNPDIAYIAIERYATVLVKLVRKIPDEGLPNLAVINIDATDLLKIFAPGEIDRIYLNFSDPWPKTKQAHRRLTHKGFLDLYRIVLAEHGAIHFKTDNRKLFDFSILEFPAADYAMSEITFDLHNSEMAEGNIQTEYEQRFSELGQPIHRLVAAPMPRTVTIDTTQQG